MRLTKALLLTPDTTNEVYMDDVKAKAQDKAPKAYDEECHRKVVIRSKAAAKAKGKAKPKPKHKSGGGHVYPSCVPDKHAEAAWTRDAVQSMCPPGFRRYRDPLNCRWQLEIPGPTRPSNSTSWLTHGYVGRAILLLRTAREIARLGGPKCPITGIF